MNTVETAVGRIGWHELLTSDVEAAKTFYGELLGWETAAFKPGEFDYQMITSGGTGHGGFMPSQEIAPEAPPHWLAYVIVEDAENTVGRAKAAGGAVLFGPSPIPEVGTIAVVADPQGASIALIQPEGEAPLPEGVFVWDELTTTDVEAAKDFYESLFGWTAETMEMGGAGLYTIFQRGDRQIAGAMARMEGDPGPPRWTTYIGVDDVDEKTEQARSLGATVYVEPTDIPDVGRFSLIADPSGAAVGLYKSATS